MTDSSFMCQLPNCRLHAQGGRDGVEEDLLFPRWKQSRQIENERQLGCNLNVGTEPLKVRLTMLSSRAANAIDQATIACVRVDLYTTLDRSDQAVDVCLSYPASSGRRMVVPSNSEKN
jgi:hypothetical protein